jgi:hypothetical protein
VQHEARTGFYRLFPFAWRSIGNESTAFGVWPRQRLVSNDRHATPIGEMVHISVLQRWGNTINSGWTKRIYRPLNLRLALDRIDKTYSDDNPRNPIYVVGWCGRRLEPNNPTSRKMVQTLINSALGREGPDPHLSIRRDSEWRAS